jgi:hypothetical protein
MSKRPVPIIVHPTSTATIYGVPAVHRKGEPCVICAERQAAKDADEDEDF